jgi:light-regulated signal transduction histidine kinase (bacteriophytochrome)
LVLRDGAGADPGALQERLNFIVQGARKIELLTDGLSKYSVAMRINRSEFRPTAMAAALRAALGRISKEVQASRAEVTYGALPTIAGNADRLTELFENLLLNALRHSGAEDPRIHVSAEQRPGAWEISVEDNGQVVDAGYLERIFKPFERLRSKESDAPGMGLAISREIVERHGGRIWAESEPRKGGLFRFIIPADGSD